MKNIKLITLVVLAISIASHSQNYQQSKSRILNILTLPNGKTAWVKDLLVSPYEIKSLYMLNQGEINKDYKEANAEIILKISLKPNVELLHINELLDNYHIQGNARDFTVLFQDSAVQDPKTLMASKSFITNVYDVPQKWVRCLRMIFSS